MSFALLSQPVEENVEKQFFTGAQAQIGVIFGASGIAVPPLQMRVPE